MYGISDSIVEIRIMRGLVSEPREANVVSQKIRGIFDGSVDGRYCARNMSIRLDVADTNSAHSVCLYLYLRWSHLFVERDEIFAKSRVEVMGLRNRIVYAPPLAVLLEFQADTHVFDSEAVG